MSDRWVRRFGIPALVLALTPVWQIQAADKVVGVIVIMPPPAAPGPPPVVQQQPGIVTWLPVPRTAPHPPPPPAARCYAEAVVCPLEDASLLGRSCTCPTKTGTVEGRGLIPPSTVRAERGARPSAPKSSAQG